MKKYFVILAFVLASISNVLAWNDISYPAYVKNQKVISVQYGTQAPKYTDLRILSYRSGKWINASGVQNTTTVSGYKTDMAYYTPVYFEDPTSISSVALRTSSGGSNTTIVKLGVFSSDSLTGMPGSLVRSSSGTLNISSGGSTYSVSLTSPVSVTAGLYYIGAIASTTTPGAVSASIIVSLPASCNAVWNRSIGGQDTASLSVTGTQCGYSAPQPYVTGLSPTVPSNTLSIPTNDLMPIYGVQIQ